jgi:hypothetical protein
MSIELLNAAQPSVIVKDVIIPLVAGFGGAVVGALVSYVPSRLLAKDASRQVLARDLTARRDQEKRAGHQIFVKLSVLVNSLCGYHRDIENMIAKAENDGNGHMPIWQRISLMAGIDREPSVDFTADELAIYVAADQTDYVDDLLLLARRYGAVLSNLATFAKLKTELVYETYSIGQTTRSEETGVSTTRMHVPASVANSINARSEELEIFAVELRSILADYDRFARNVAEKFGPLTNGYLGAKTVPCFTPIEAGG